MDKLLFLAHRLPYPPNKGDKIRSYHVLRYLAERYRVYLGTFIDDPDDWEHVATLEALCEEVFVRPLKPRTARIKSLTGLLTGSPLTLPYYDDRAMHQWVQERLDRKGIQRVFAFSSAMGQFVPDDTGDDVIRVMDFVDVDSDKWLQYSERQSWPMNWVYRREGRQLLAYDRQIACRWDASLLVSEAEADLFRQLVPEASDRIHALNNGVDLDYFSPGHDLASPYPPGQQALVFTGAMDYWANVDAVSWFARDIWPQVRARHPKAQFYIVGARPTADVLALAQLPGVTVTGTVPDVRPYVLHAALAVAPLRIARGIQNKVLEAMALGMRLILSPAAADGIPLQGGIPGTCVEAGPQAFADACNAALDAPWTSQQAAGVRQWICERWAWSANLAGLDRWVEQSGAGETANAVAGSA